MEHAPFEDVFPIESGDIPLLCQFTGGTVLWWITMFSGNTLDTTLPPRMRTRGIEMFHVILVVTIASWVKTLQ